MIGREGDSHPAGQLRDRPAASESRAGSEPWAAPVAGR
jgi:hypothetical protein